MVNGVHHYCRWFVDRACLDKYPKSKQLLDREVTTSGAYLPDLDDPDHANPFASTAWEFAITKQAYHPYLPKYASNLLDGGALSTNLLRTTPTALHSAYDCSAGSNSFSFFYLLSRCADVFAYFVAFNPPMPLPAIVSKTQTKKDRVKRKVSVLLRRFAALLLSWLSWLGLLDVVTDEGC